MTTRRAMAATNIPQILVLFMKVSFLRPSQVGLLGFFRRPDAFVAPVYPDSRRASCRLPLLYWLAFAANRNSFLLIFMDPSNSFATTVARTSYFFCPSVTMAWRYAPSSVPSIGSWPFLLVTVPAILFPSCWIAQRWFITPSMVLKTCTFQLPAMFGIFFAVAATLAAWAESSDEIYGVLSSLTK